jgi:hypothetical protein
VVATPGIHRTASSRCRAVAADGRTPSEPNSTSRTIAGSGGAPTSPDVVIRQAGGSHQSRPCVRRGPGGCLSPWRSWLMSQRGTTA